MKFSTGSLFNDSRLEKTFSSFLEHISSRYTTVIHQLSEDRAEEVSFHRFLNNVKVTPERIISEHWNKSSIDLSGKHILVLGDTSTISFSPNKNRTDLGYIGSNTNKTGFFLHASLLLEAQTRACYGLAGIQTYKLDFPDSGLSADEKQANKWKKSQRPFHQKERYKWLSCPQQAIVNASGAAHYTLVGDRESDIYDVMAGTLAQNHNFIYRCNYNRRLDVDNKLLDVIDKQEVQCCFELDLPATKKRSKHKAKLALKFTEVTLPIPANNPDKTLPNQLKVNVVEVKESPSTVVGDEESIHWVILTSHPVNTTEDALKIIEWYRWRWSIEQLFRTIKSKGLAIEQSQLESYRGLVNLTTLALIAASQVMQLVESREGENQQELQNVFFPEEQECIKALSNKLEGKTDKQKNPHQPKSLAFGSWVMARLGGWSGYKSERPPGPITMLRGLIKFYNILEGYYLKL